MQSERTKVINDLYAAAQREKPGETLAAITNAIQHLQASEHAAEDSAPAAPMSAQPSSPWLKALELRMAQGWVLKGDRLPVLYTDSINGDQVCRDDLWLCTTAALAAATQPPAAPGEQDAEVAASEVLHALRRLYANFPTDTDLYYASWEALEIKAACNAYELAGKVIERHGGAA